MVKPKIFSEEQVQDFEQDGFLIVRGMYGPEEMATLSTWTDEIASYPEVPGTYMMYFEESLVEPGKRLLSRIENYCPYHSGFAGLLNGEDLLERVGELFGEPAVLFKDKINFKLPGGGSFEAHQDVQAGWDAYASRHISVLISIDPANRENGCLELASGYHKQGMLGESWCPLQERTDIEFFPCQTEPGDVVFFDSYTPHRSGPNLSAKQRRALYVTYNCLSEGDHRTQYYADKRRNYPPDCERETGKQYVFRV